MGWNAGPGTLTKCVGKLPANVARPIKLGFKGYAFPGTANGRQHGGNNLIAILECRNPVSLVLDRGCFAGRTEPLWTVCD
jgi:hypothetical protein